MSSNVYYVMWMDSWIGYCSQLHNSIPTKCVWLTYRALVHRTVLKNLSEIKNLVIFASLDTHTPSICGDYIILIRDMVNKHKYGQFYSNMQFKNITWYQLLKIASCKFLTSMNKELLTQFRDSPEDGSLLMPSQIHFVFNTSIDRCEVLG